MDGTTQQFVQSVLSTLPPRREVIEIGSLDVNGAVRQFLPDAYYIGVDMRAGKGVDVVADALVWRPSYPVDTVLCLNTIEHYRRQEGLIKACYEMLVPGGVLIFVGPVDPFPRHRMGEGTPRKQFYRNVTPEDLKRWTAGRFLWTAHVSETHQLLGVGTRL